jgi:hypothetical protein
LGIVYYLYNVQLAGLKPANNYVNKTTYYSSIR